MNGSRQNTDATGQVVYNLRKGTYPAKVKKNGYSQVTTTINVDAAAVTQEIVLVEKA